MGWKILKYQELTKDQKLAVVDIFIEGFGHLMTFTKDTEKLKSLFLHSLNPTYTYALVEEGIVLGILGLGTNQVRPIRFVKANCEELFGRWKGKILCAEMNAIFQSKVVENDSDLYIDVLATSKESRGKGVATRLLEYSLTLPEYNTYYIEVMSKNETAKRLYEKLGFVEVKKNRFSPVAFQGYGYPIKMKR